MDIIKARNDLLLGKTIYDMNLRVVDYGRVSTDKDEQVNSLENQINYFNDFIKGVKKWKHVNSYVDEGLSGTEVRKREQFLKMIEDAKNGKIDLILTKEVSRFARNTIDSIKYTQLLLSYGVIVFFITDNINTIYKDSEFRLTLMASMAQDEVRKLSERVKFGIKRSIKDGKVGGGGLYGYLKHNSKLTIIEDEAKVVKMIFKMYSSENYGLKKIGEVLAKRNIFTRKGKVFSDTSLKKMIKNPRYKGFYTANLSEVEDYKTHKRIYKDKKEWIIYKDNKGFIPAIVSEKLWKKANEILEKNSKKNKSIFENRMYTSKIICYEHNIPFIRSASGKRKNNPVWQCNNYLRHGLKGCITPRLFEKDLNIIFNKIIKNKIKKYNNLNEEIINDYKVIINKVELRSNNLEEKIKKLEIMKEKLLDLLLNKIINESEYIEKNNKIKKELEIISNNKINNCINLNKIDKEIKRLLVVENNIKDYFNIFVNKIIVSKINNNRNNIRLRIVFNYEDDDMIVDINNKVSLDKIPAIQGL